MKITRIFGLLILSIFLFQACSVTSVFYRTKSQIVDYYYESKGKSRSFISTNLRSGGNLKVVGEVEVHEISYVGMGSNIELAVRLFIPKQGDDKKLKNKCIYIHRSGKLYVQTKKKRIYEVGISSVYGYALLGKSNINSVIIHPGVEQYPIVSNKLYLEEGIEDDPITKIAYVQKKFHPLKIEFTEFAKSKRKF